MREHRAAREVHALEVHVHHAVPGFFAGVDGPAHLHDADVVVEDVDASVGGDAVLDEPLDVGGLGDVGDDRLGAVALAADDADGLVDRLALAVDRDDVRALAGEQHGRGLAVAPTGPRRASPRDDRDLILQSTRHVASPTAEYRKSGMAASAELERAATRHRRLRHPRRHMLPAASIPAAAEFHTRRRRRPHRAALA